MTEVAQTPEAQPELLEALKEMTARMELYSGNHDNALVTMARAAIAKATGASDGAPLRATKADSGTNNLSSPPEPIGGGAEREFAADCCNERGELCCDISGLCEPHDEERDQPEAMCRHCGGTRTKDYPDVGNWGIKP